MREATELRSNYANFTRLGNTLYMHVHFWPGTDVAISGLKQKVLSAKLLKKSTLKIYEKFPHGMCTTQPEVVNADLLAFIKG